MPDLSGQYYGAYERFLAQAKLHFEQGHYPEASAAYRQCAGYLDRYADTSRVAAVQARWKKQAAEYRKQADLIDSGKLAMPGAVATESGAAAENDLDAAVTALVQRVDVSWDDIAGLEETKREIKSAYGLALARKPEGVRLRGWRNILFYGPPGTGKTLLAAATSRGLDATFYNVKVSSVLSKFFGESSRLISALYAGARRAAPAVVFMDEFEALTPPRDDNQSGVEARIVSTFLAELDGLAQKGESGYVMTLAATNVPWLVDKAVLSRFEKRIYVPLPDEPARRRVLEIELDRHGHHSLVGIDELVTRTNGYSGREITRLCSEAIKNMVNRLNRELTDKVDLGREAIAAYQVKVGPLESLDWEPAFGSFHPETSPADLRKFDNWASGAG